MGNVLKFDEETHTYTLGGKVLPSVTSILDAVLFHDKYNGVDEETLKLASEKGRLIHKEISDYILDGKIGFTEELNNFIKLKKEKELDLLDSEFIVANNKYAGTVDLMFYYKGKLCIGDIKTTYNLDKEYVSWQLSLYKYLYESRVSRLCPYPIDFDGNYVEIKELYAIWLRDDKAKFEKVEMKSKEQVEEVLCAFVEGRTIDFYGATLQTIPLDKQIALNDLLHQMKDIEEKTKGIKEAILNEMNERGLDKVILGDVTITRKSGGVRTSVDTTKLKEDGLYDKYTKTSEVKPSIMIKVGDR